MRARVAQDKHGIGGDMQFGIIDTPGQIVDVVEDHRAAGVLQQVGRHRRSS